ncbi:MAG TPA: cytochrome c [Nitrospirota bacterium]|nr:cytochrome c [Nitrospirota bacterium]
MIHFRTLLILSVALVLSGTLPGQARAAGDARRGEYLAKIANCVGCHTEDRESAVPYAGGRAIKTPFGTFYGPNITPDPGEGIGTWKEADFIRAMRFGIRPDGSPYFPAFPYTSFTRITESDLQDLWVYLRTIRPDKTKSKRHDIPFFVRWRLPLHVWQGMFFTRGPLTHDPKLSYQAGRGEYIVQALGHCSECHTPRNLLGAPKKDRFLAGGMGPEGKKVPNITPTRLNKWSDKDLKDYLTTGILPDGDVANKVMGDVIRDSTKWLSPADLDAVVAYLRAVPPLPDEPGR